MTDRFKTAAAKAVPRSLIDVIARLILRSRAPAKIIVEPIKAYEDGDPRHYCLELDTVVPDRPIRTLGLFCPPIPVDGRMPSWLSPNAYVDFTCDGVNWTSDFYRDHPIYPASRILWDRVKMIRFQRPPFISYGQCKPCSLSEKFA